MNHEIRGWCAPEFESVAEEFHNQYKKQEKGGGAFSAYHYGEKIIDIWIGDARENQPWDEETLSVIFSCTKGLVAIIASQLVDEGLLDLEAPVAKYWSEFAQAGKENIKVRWVLQHRAGLSATREDLTFEEVIAGEPVCNALARQEPLWEPNSGHAYHSITFGHLMGRIFLGATGKRLGQLFQERIARPLHVKAFIGLPKSEEVYVSELMAAIPYQSSKAPVNSPDYWVERALTFGRAMPLENLGTPGVGFNDPRFHASENGGAGGISSAAALAKIWSATVYETDGVRLLSDQSIARDCQPGWFGASVWGDLPPWQIRANGYMIESEARQKTLSLSTFGHDGLGGQAGFADVKHRASFAHLTNYLMQGEGEHERWSKPVERLRKIFESKF